MKKKAKLIATLSSLGLALAMMVFAVYAATSVTFKVTTNVSFEATKHVQATITARDSGATNVALTKDSTYSNLAETGANQEIGVNSNGQTTGKVEDVKFKQTELTASNKYYGYQITITNNDNENALPISITTPEKQGSGYDITWDGNAITSIDVGETKKITCIIEITDLAGNKVTINNADLGLDIMLGEEELEPTLDYLTFDLVENGDEDYYKVRMSEENSNAQTLSSYEVSLLFDGGFIDGPGDNTPDSPELEPETEYIELPETIIIPSHYKNLPVKEIYGLSYTFYEKVKKIVLPETIETIGEYSFQDCEALTSIEIPDNVTTIGSHAFYGCSSLTTIEIPDNVTTIGAYAFYRCSRLITITLPSQLSSIGAYAFYRCSRLITITLPSQLSSIGTDAFLECYKLTEVINKSELNITAGSSDHGGVGKCALVVHNGDKSLIEVVTGVYYFTDTLNDDDSTNDKVYAIAPTDINCINITIKEGTTDIKVGAFNSCALLTSIELPEGLKIIGNSAFYNCVSLTSIKIPASVTTIGFAAFMIEGGQYLLKSIVIPASVTTIGRGAFFGCKSLTIFCESISKPTDWDLDWNSSGCPVSWGLGTEWDYVNGVPQPK